MKDCYFFRGKSGIWIQTKTKLVFLLEGTYSVSLKGIRNKIAHIRDMRTGKYYYPAKDGAMIQ